MFAQSPERLVAVVRWGLVLGWIGILILCFHDFGLIALSDPDSPAAITGWAGSPISLRGETLDPQPYNPGPRLFWGTAIPLVVLLLVVAGHETWRRICPLSAIAQIPRRLGLQRRVGAGRNRQVALVDPQSWWARHALMIQFGLFVTGVALRLTVLSAAPQALAVVTLSIFALALVVGVLWGGKTWCHYVCPMNAVQLAINGPRGLGDTPAHRSVGLSQSMCRKSAPGGDVPTCVGCNASCPDVDLERSYWDRLPGLHGHLVVYGYLGVVLGFIHVLQLAAPGGYGGAIWYDTQWSAPGWTWDGGSVSWPRYLTTPLTLLAWVLITMTVGALAERIVAAWKGRGGEREAIRIQARHRIMTMATACALGLLVIEVAVPGLVWLGPTAGMLVTVLAVAAVSMWGYRTWQRSSQAHQRDLLAASLRRRLAQFPVDLRSHLQGRRLDDLSTDEVHLLADLVPRLEEDQRVRFYDRVLADALAGGQADTLEGRRLLTHMRERLGISDEVHRSLVAGQSQVGSSADSIIGTQILRMDSYRHQIEQIVLDAVEQGADLEEALARHAERIQWLRQEYGISEAEEEQVLAQLGADGGMLQRGMEGLIEQLHTISALQGALAADRLAERHLQRILEREAVAVTRQCLGLVEALGVGLDDPALQARRLADAHYQALCAVLADPRGEWTQRLLPAFLTTLAAYDDDHLPVHQEEHVLAPAEVLRRLMAAEEPVTALVACQAARDRGMAEARSAAASLVARTVDANVATLARRLSENDPAGGLALRVSGAQLEPVICHQRLLVGRAASADVTLNDPHASRHHFLLGVDGTVAWCEDRGSRHGTLVGETLLRGERMVLSPRCEIRCSRQSPPLVVESFHTGIAQAEDALAIFLILTEVPLFAAMDDGDLLAFTAEGEPRTLAAGETLLRRGAVVDHIMVLCRGHAEVLVDDRQVGTIAAGEPVAELAVLSGEGASADVITRSDGMLVAWPVERFRAVLAQRPAVALAMLQLTGRRLAASLAAHSFHHATQEG